MKWIFLIFVVALVGCKTNHKAVEFKPDFTANAPTLVYKTKANYNNNVPITLSEDKTKVISYPHPNDLKNGNTFSIPSSLNKGYLLDNRGIGKNTVFIKFTYEEYSKLETVPSLKELYDMIIDKDPITELCNCGSKYAFKDPIKQLNILIDSKELRKVCKIIR